ncbi:FAD/NAD(P)-binding domain-containing protein [Ceratobasidium sp. AG-I]|nr:FAD/NAD(P)-binding domain-containing protein [Ceratobasidium sp. AG-I]
MSAHKNIVIIGSGGGGVPLAQALQKTLNKDTHQIILIEKRDYYAHWPSLIRAAVTSDGDIEDRGLIPLDRAFDSSVRLVRSQAKEVDGSQVVLESGEVIPYEHLVFSTGSIWTGALALPDSKAAAVEHLKSFRKSLNAVEHVLIVGGGTAGIEYAGEIRHYYPEKKVTIVHGGSELLNKTYPAKYRKSLLDGVTKMGAQVIFGDKISPTVTPEGGYVVTEKGQRIRADFVISAAGGRPNTNIVRTLDPSALTDAGTVRVTPEFRVKLASGAQNVWAIGDIIDWAEQKLVFKVSTAHVPVLAKNILASIQGGKTTVYAGTPEWSMVTLGPAGGRGLVPFFGGIVLGDWFVSKLKAGDLAMGRARAGLGY